MSTLTDTEKMQEYFDEKFEALAQDIDKTKLAAMRKDFTEQFEQFKKDVQKSRDFTGAGDGKANPYARTKVFTDTISSEVTPVSFGRYLQSCDPQFLKGLAGWSRAVCNKEHNISLPDVVIRALGEASGATGGFFVPIEFKPELLKLVIESQLVRPRASVFPMATDTMWIPRIVDTSHVTGIHGGAGGTWTVEATTISQKDPTAGQIQLIAKKFSDYVLVSNELIQDSAIAIPAMLSVLLREGLGFFEDVSAIEGAGAGQMMGFLNSPALVSVTPVKAAHINYADVVSMYSRMFPSSHDNAVWACSPDAWPDIAQMALAVGTGGSAVWITNYTTAQGAPPATIFGRPLIISEKLPALGSANCLVYCDFSYYIIGDRMQMSLTTSEHVAFASDQTAFRIIERLDGQPWINSPLTPHNASSNTLSAFVGLAAS